MNIERVKATYVKYVPNVFLAKCDQTCQKGDVIILTTKYGKENECVVHNLVFQKDNFYYYSITRADGFNAQERAKNKADKYSDWANSSDAKSHAYYEKSNQHSDFLSLGEPIKVGHHSEKRHRRIIEQANDNMRKSVELLDKSDQHKGKAEYWASRANDINLSMPESVEFFEYELEKAKEHHEGLLSGKYKREHSFSLTYAKKNVNEISKKLDIAKKLWS